MIDYFLDGQIYNGSVYLKSDKTNKYGFTCFIDPEYKQKLDVKERKPNSLDIHHKETKIYLKHKFPDISENKQVCIDIHGKKQKCQEESPKKKLYRFNLISILCSTIIFFIIFL